MRTRKFAFAITLLLLAAGSSGQQEKLSVILPAREAKAVAALYPKKGPQRINGSWEATETDIDDLEANLSQISDFEFNARGPIHRIEHPDQYFRQYVAVLRAGQKMIFVNAFCEKQLSPGLHDRLVIVSDGGSCFWHALYDPAAQKFSDLEVNGTA